MSDPTRREFGMATAALALSLAPGAARAQATRPSKARVVVVGGGIGGATVAKYLAIGAPTLDVTLVEPKTRHTTCVFGNLYLAGLRSLDSLTYGYDALADRYGIKLIHEAATTIDPSARIVQLQSGTKLPYDRLVVSPGIAFKFGAIAGYDEAATQLMPHAWTGGLQARLLRARLEAMEDGGTFVIAAPPNPSRCPPGPYERASMAAYYFKQFKPRSKILILDAKETFFGQDLFEDAWNRHYPGMIEWLPSEFTGGVKAVDVKASVVRTAGDAFKADVANIIPAQLAGDLAQTAGLADASGWCPVDPLSFESTLHPAIHVIGDAASAGAMPKSAFSANSQAKACAFAIVAALTGAARSAPYLFNSCFTYLAADDAISNAISFKRTDGTIGIDRLFISAVGDPSETRRHAVKQANSWYDAFTHDVFG